MTIREPKDSDQENVQEAYELLLQLIQDNEERIEPTLWVGAMIGALAENYETSGISFKEFEREILECVEFYEYPRKE